METFGNPVLEKRISNIGFKKCRYDPECRIIATKGLNSDNCIFIRDLKMVEKRVREADPFQLGRKEY